MPSRATALSLAAVAVLGLAGCEKQSPYVTLTGGGRTVKARATNYCRGAECDKGGDVPVLRVSPGDTIGIDVPRSLAEQGWAIPALQDQGFRKDHYRTFTLPEGIRPGDVTLTVVRDERAGAGQWQFTLRVE
jgi:hypothetical protein